MNARQKMKNLKKKISKLQSDNDLMHRIIADSPTMQELYDLYNKPMNITHTTMHFQEYKVKRLIPIYMADADGIELIKQAASKDLFEGIKDTINYEIEPEESIVASIFVGIK